MTRNPILEEIYAAREKLLADAGGDVRKYLAGVREREVASGRLLVSTTQRAIQCAGVAEAGSLTIETQSPPPDFR